MNHISAVDATRLGVGGVTEVMIDRIDGDAVEVKLNPKRQLPPVEARVPSGRSSTAVIPAGGIALEKLRCGMAFNGTVVTCTMYAAFVNIQVYRRASGGIFKSINGLLHDSDIIQRHRFLPLRYFGSRSLRTKGKPDELALERGSEVTVYVKEVFPNSG